MRTRGNEKRLCFGFELFPVWREQSDDKISMTYSWKYKLNVNESASTSYEKNQFETGTFTMAIPILSVD